MLLILKNRILKIYLWFKIKITRRRLHIALDKCDESRILEISRKLDVIILKVSDRMVLSNNFGKNHFDAYKLTK